jgi:UDP-2-acetamido-3-amino-2,3-dideoxy-glucuronate N-acetyltransferase
LIHGTAIINKQPLKSKTFARQVGEQVECIIERDVAIDAYAVIFAGSHIGQGSIIGIGATVREGARIGNNCVIGQGVRIGHDCVIGDNVQIMDDAHLSGGCTVGEGSFIGQNACTANDDDPVGYQLTELKPVHIGKRCLIGHNATLRAGITIGDEARVASGAIVVKDVPAAVTVMGLAAKTKRGGK